MKIGIGTSGFPVLRDWIKLLKVAGEEHTLVCSKEGIKILSMDPSHVLMVDTNIKASLFDSYEVEGDVERVTVNVLELGRFLDRIGKDERVELFTPKDAKLNIAASKSGFRRNFKVPIMEPYEDEVPEPKINFKTSSRLTVKAFEIATKDAGLVSDHIKISLNDAQMTMNAEGDIGSAASEWTKDSDDLLDLKGEEDATATFTLTYIADIVGALKPLADVVEIELSSDMPIKFVGECTKEQVEATFYLAPVIGV